MVITRNFTMLNTMMGVLKPKSLLVLAMVADHDISDLDLREKSKY